MTVKPVERFLVSITVTTLVIVFVAALSCANGAVSTPSRMSRSGAGPAMSSGMMPGLQQNPLTAEQREQIMNIRRNAMAQMQDIRSDSSLSQQQKFDQIRDVQQSMHSQVMDVLTPAQTQEFQQWWQDRQMGMGAGPQMHMGAGPDNRMGTVPGIEQNPLTAGQRQQITNIRRTAMAQIRNIRNDASLSQQQKANQIRDVTQSMHDQVMNVLTPEQHQEFTNWWQSKQGRMGGQSGAGLGNEQDQSVQQDQDTQDDAVLL